MEKITRPRRKAMAVALVLVLTAAMLIACASVLNLVTREKVMSRRTAAIAELKQSTDTLLGYAGSQIATNPGISPANIALVPESLFSTETNTISAVSPDNQEIIASQLTRLTDPTTNQITKFHIDPAAAINRTDKLRGQMVYRDLCVLGSKAAVRAPGSTEIIHEYGAMILERRLIHIFNYLAFFDVANFRISNPGSNIVLDGPIQANRGIKFEASNHPSTVNILSTLHTPGKFEFTGRTSTGKFMITNGTAKPNGAPNMVDMLKPSTTTLRQTSDDINSSGQIIGTTFKDFMTGSTNGYLGTGEAGESTVALDGLNYSDDSSAMIPNSMKLVNNRRIDPPNPALRDSTDPAYAEARVAEAAKTAYQAGLYAYVEQNGELTTFIGSSRMEKGRIVGIPACAAMESYKKAPDKAAWKAGNGDKILAPSEVKGFITMPAVDRYNSDPADYAASNKNTDLARGAIFDAQQKSTVAMVDVDLGALKTKIAGGALRLANGTSQATSGPQGWNGVFYVDVENPASRPAAPVRTEVTNPLTGAKSIQYINPTTLRPDPATTADNALKTTLPSLNITKNATDWQTGAPIADTTGLTAVRIKNATEVPGARVGDPGFTLATNTATYTVGSVNADGDLRTGTTSLQDDQGSPNASSEKIPMAIFSDKNVVLSGDFASPAYDLDIYVPKPSSYPPGLNASNWPFTGPSATTLRGNGNGYCQYQRPPSARVMELNTGFIIGDDDSSNKGIHTMLSYIQPFNTSNDTLRMRGALIGIYKSRYFKGAAGSFNDYYIAPVRTFGYSSLFKAGKMPPAAPTISNYRRMRQFTISKADYEALKLLHGQPPAGWLNILGSKY